MGQNKEAEQIAALGSFIESKVIAEISGVIKSGKEATVYLCRAYDARYTPPWIAAKVYRDREVRRFSNDAAYMEGRGRGLNRRDALAVATKSPAGRCIAFGEWAAEEWSTLNLLFDARGDVPEPVDHAGRVVLMEYVGDEDGAAPLLSAVRLERDTARRVFDRLLRNIELMLACDRIHGDLSAYNVLYLGGDEVRLIDFPQAVDPRFNSSALSLLERDIGNICQHLSRFGVEADAHAIARDLWSRFLRSDL